jgi:hypothetical protein
LVVSGAANARRWHGGSGSHRNGTRENSALLRRNSSGRSVPFSPRAAAGPSVRCRQDSGRQVSASDIQSAGVLRRAVPARCAEQKSAQVVDTRRATKPAAIHVEFARRAPIITLNDPVGGVVVAEHSFSASLLTEAHTRASGHPSTDFLADQPVSVVIRHTSAEEGGRSHYSSHGDLRHATPAAACVARHGAIGHANLERSPHPFTWRAGRSGQ